jgi:hypothetical protein
VKTTFKLKINIIRNPLNFKSIQWKHLQAFPISWDYPISVKCIPWSLRHFQKHYTVSSWNIQRNFYPSKGVKKL